MVSDHHFRHTTSTRLRRARSPGGLILAHDAVATAASTANHNGRGCSSHRAAESRASATAPSSSLVAALVSLSQPPPGWIRLLLCRHGETASNARQLLQGAGSDPPLNERGEAQARGLAAELAAALPGALPGPTAGAASASPGGSVPARIDVVASSHMRRAIATADMVAARFPDARRVCMPDLCEMRYGALEGAPMAKVATEIGDIARRWKNGETDLKVGGADGESPEDLLARAVCSLSRLASGSFGGRCGGATPERPVQILVVAHSHFNKALLSAASGKGLARIHSVPQDNGCLSVIDLPAPRSQPANAGIVGVDAGDIDGRWKVLHVNLTPMMEHPSTARM